MKLLVALLSGIVFGLGLGISGMTDPTKVLAFLDFTGNWDPSLLLVMGAALMVNAGVWFLTRRRERPTFDAEFHMPASQRIDFRLVGGSAIFGIGWGLSGFCPGAAIAAAPSAATSVLVFIASMGVGMLFYGAVVAFAGARRETSPETSPLKAVADG